MKNEIESRTPPMTDTEELERLARAAEVAAENLQPDMIGLEDYLDATHKLGKMPKAILSLLEEHKALKARVEELEEATKCLVGASYTRGGRDELEGLPDSHGFYFAWSDEFEEEDGIPFEDRSTIITAGQLRRARQALGDSHD